MRPHLVFWISAAVRMTIILAMSAVAAYFFGVVTGLALALISMIVLIVVQLQYLLNLSDWLDNPNSARLPDGWGAWTEIFSRLYKLRRGDEKNQSECFSFNK